MDNFLLAGKPQNIWQVCFQTWIRKRKFPYWMKDRGKKFGIASKVTDG